MRLGILGGTFDPIHIGHLILAEEAWYQLGLQKVLLVPAGDPPHKRGRRLSPVEHRVRMIELAIADNPHLELSRAEVRSRQRSVQGSMAAGCDAQKLGYLADRGGLPAKFAAS